jgi:hypothetical protein
VELGGAIELHAAFRKESRTSKRTPLPGAADLLRKPKPMHSLRLPQKTQKDRILSNFTENRGTSRTLLAQPARVMTGQKPAA